MSKYKTRPAEDRFFEKVQKTDTCWLWLGAIAGGHYGRFRDAAGKTMLAHRWAYCHTKGPIPAGLDLDHICRVRHCVNPAHLEPVTRKENLYRGIGPALKRLNRGKATHCRNGHEFTKESSGFDKNGLRRCLICTRLNCKRSRVNTKLRRNK